MWTAGRQSLLPLSAILKHHSPIKLIDMSEELRICVSVGQDGRLVWTSTISGEFLNGMELGPSDPSLVAVSDFGWIAVAFSRRGVHLVNIVDQNLVPVAQKVFSVGIRCWKCVPWGGGAEYVVACFADLRIVAFRLPFLDEINVDVVVASEARALEVQAMALDRRRRALGSPGNPRAVRKRESAIGARRGGRLSRRDARLAPRLEQRFTPAGASSFPARLPCGQGTRLRPSLSRAMVPGCCIARGSGSAIGGGPCRWHRPIQALGCLGETCDVAASAAPGAFIERVRRPRARGERVSREDNAAATPWAIAARSRVSKLGALERSPPLERESGSVDPPRGRRLSRRTEGRRRPALAGFRARGGPRAELRRPR